MIAKELEECLHEALAEARRLRHEEITVEHLLVAILDDASVKIIFITKVVDVEKLRSELSEYINRNASIQSGTEDVDTMPTLGFLRVIQRAIMWVQQNDTGGNEVTCAHVLMSIYSERGQAVQFLHANGLTRNDVLALIGIKAPDSYLDSKRYSLPVAMELEGGTAEEAYASLEQKGYFSLPTRPWSLGFHARGKERNDFTVLDKFGDLVLEAPNRIVAEFILTAVNKYQE